MKKILLSLLTVAITITFINAQQMSYYVNMSGDQGQSFPIAQDTSLVVPSDLDIDLSDTGANVIWNFQGLDMDLQDTINFVDLTGPEPVDFPTGNVVVESNLGRVVFDRNIGSGLYLLGSDVTFAGTQMSVNYVPAQRTLPEASGLHTKDSTISYISEKVYVGIDTTIFTCHLVIDTIWLKRRADYKINFDATGELRLPLDTFDYTLRSLSSEQTVDSIFVYCPIGINAATCFGMSAPVGWSLAPDQLIALSGFADSAVTHNTTWTATWYNPYTISPVCIIDFTYDPGFSDTNFVTARFKSTDTPDIGFEEVNQISLKVYPNPASNILILKTDVSLNDATMYIYNAQGQQIRATNLNGGNTLDVSDLTNGIYFYQLANGTKLLHHGKFIIKK